MIRLAKYNKENNTLVLFEKYFKTTAEIKSDMRKNPQNYMKGAVYYPVEVKSTLQMEITEHAKIVEEEL